MAAYSSGDWHVKPGREAEFVAMWKELADWSGTEFDTGGWAKLLHDEDDPSHYVSVGFWPNEAVISEWRASDDLKKRMESIRALVDKGEIHSYEVAVEVTGRGAS